MKKLKQIVWIGSSRKDLAGFPDSAKKVAGTELMRLQSGLPPQNSRPFQTIGKGVFEIKVKIQSGAYRVMYVTKIKDSIAVLHCFEKKSQRTRKQDIELAAERLRLLKLNLQGGS